MTASRIVSRRCAGPFTVVAILACLMPAAAAAGRNQASGEGDPTTLRFSWPASLFARVSFENVRVRVDGDRRSRLASRGVYTLTTEALPEGVASAGGALRVRITDMAVEVDGPAGREPGLQSLIARAAAAYPDYIVGRGGAIVRIAGVRALRNALFRNLDDQPLALTAARRDRVREVLERALDERVLRARLGEQWYAQVGAWAGATLEPGRRYAVRTSAPVSLLGGAAVPLETTFEYRGGVGCEKDHALSARACVSLRMRSRVDGAKVRPVLAEIVARLAKEKKVAISIYGLSIVRTVTVVTEPDTLVPHRVEIEKRTELDIGEGKRRARRVRMDRQALRYLYR